MDRVTYLKDESARFFSLYLALYLFLSLSPFLWFFWWKTKLIQYICTTVNRIAWKNFRKDTCWYWQWRHKKLPFCFYFFFSLSWCCCCYCWLFRMCSFLCMCYTWWLAGCWCFFSCLFVCFVRYQPPLPLSLPSHTLRARSPAIWCFVFIHWLQSIFSIFIAWKLMLDSPIHKISTVNLYGNMYCCCCCHCTNCTFIQCCRTFFTISMPSMPITRIYGGKKWAIFLLFLLLFFSFG